MLSHHLMLVFNGYLTINLGHKLPCISEACYVVGITLQGSLKHGEVIKQYPWLWHVDVFMEQYSICHLKKERVW